MFDRVYLLLALVAVLCCNVGTALGKKDFSAVNANIEWKTLADLQSRDWNWAENKKPVMYLFTQPWCGACNRLKETMTAEGDGKTRMELFSKHYVMVSVDGDENNNLEDQFKPDGAAYIPRVLFAGPDGQVRPELVNPHNSQYKYFYTSAPALANAMEDMLPVFYPGYKKKKSPADAKKKKCPFVKSDDDEDEETDEDEYEDVADDEEDERAEL